MNEPTPWRSEFHYIGKALRTFFAIVTVGVLLFSGCYFARVHIRERLHVGPDDAKILRLPHDASDVNYLIRGNCVLILADFHIDEESFEIWVASYESSFLGGKLQRKDKGDMMVDRYDDSAKEWKLEYIDDGVQCFWYDGDRGIKISFDRKTGRGYICISTT